MKFPDEFKQPIAQDAAFLIQMVYDQFRNPDWNLGAGYKVFETLLAQGERFGFVAQNLKMKTYSWSSAALRPSRTGWRICHFLRSHTLGAWWRRDSRKCTGIAPKK